MLYGHWISAASEFGHRILAKLVESKNGKVEVMLKACPRCSYSLKGLPGDHKCPECGLPYDDNTIAVRQNRRGWKVFLILNACTCAVGFLLWIINPSRFAWNPFIAFALPTLLVYLWRMRSRTPVVVLSKAMMHILNSGNGDCRYALGDVAEAQWSAVDGSVELLDRKGEVVVRLPRGLLWSHSRAKKLVQEINQRVDNT